MLLRLQLPAPSPADAATWRRMIADKIAGGEEGPAAAAGWDLLGRVLRPLMWRNTKSVVAQEFHLPHRTLRPTWLAFQAGERAFYDQVRARLQHLHSLNDGRWPSRLAHSPVCGLRLHSKSRPLLSPPAPNTGGGAGAGGARGAGHLSAAAGGGARRR